MTTDRQLYWHNKKVEELTREELIAAMYRMQELLEAEKRWGAEVAKTTAAFSRAAGLLNPLKRY